LLVIEDAKLADIGATNDAGFYYAARRADAVTYAPFAGNIGEATSQAHARGIGIIVLSLMSNPEYEQEKQKRADSAGQPQYLTIAEEAAAANADAVVVGAPSETNHIEDEEIRAVRDRIGSHMVVLMPGVGAQGGSALSVWRVFDTDQVIVNAGRSLMFPNGSESTPGQQARAALELRDRLNEERSVS
jgi:orotidine-5'-phosphate decarboxylase